jgi:hypothetical protein
LPNTPYRTRIYWFGAAYHGFFRQNAPFKKYAKAKFDQEILPFIVAEIVSKCLPEQARKDGK